MTITFSGFDLAFLKTTLKVTLYELLQGKVYLLISIILKQNNYSFLTLMYFPYFPFKAVFVYVSYAINVTNVFHDINIALYIVTCSQSIQNITRNS